MGAVSEIGARASLSKPREVLEDERDCRRGELKSRFAFSEYDEISPCKEKEIELSHRKPAWQEQ